MDADCLVCRTTLSVQPAAHDQAGRDDLTARDGFTTDAHYHHAHYQQPEAKAKKRRSTLVRKGEGDRAVDNRPLAQRPAKKRPRCTPGCF